jgi:hypothetical protein
MEAVPSLLLACLRPRRNNRKREYGIFSDEQRSCMLEIKTLMGEVFSDDGEIMEEEEEEGEEEEEEEEEEDDVVVCAEGEDEVEEEGGGEDEVEDVGEHPGPEDGPSDSQFDSPASQTPPVQPQTTTVRYNPWRHAIVLFSD